MLAVALLGVAAAAVLLLASRPQPGGAPGEIVAWRMLGVSPDGSALLVLPEAARTECDWFAVSSAGDATKRIVVRVRFVRERCPGGEILAGIPLSPVLVPLPKQQDMLGAQITGPGFRGPAAIPGSERARWRTVNVVGLRSPLAARLLELSGSKVHPGKPPSQPAYVTQQMPQGALPGPSPPSVQLTFNDG